MFIGGLLMLAASQAIADRINPFAKPDREQQPVIQTDAPATGRIELRGVIVAGANSIANLDGQLLSIGEEAEGYTLERVEEGSATFMHNKELVTLTVRDELGSDE